MLSENERLGSVSIMSRSGNVLMAVRSLRRNKTRSLLTMIGVIIGVMSVVLVISIGEGIKHQIGAQTEHLGKDLITIRPGQLLGSSADIFSTQIFTGARYQNGSLTSDDLNTIAKTPGVSGAGPLSIVRSGVQSSEQQQIDNSITVIGTSPLLPVLLRQSLSYGAFFNDDSTMTDKVILGSNAAAKLFEERVPLGQSLTILGHQFIVIGIFNDFSPLPLSSEVNFNNAAFIPYSSAQSITNNNTPLYEVLARPGDTTLTDSVVASMTGRLLAAHGGQHDFSVLKQSDSAAVTNSILRLLTVLISGFAAIAVVVGGIGIMNIMLVSVAERMHEIGIRKALGATNRQILAQFMTEATVLSLTGGAIGLMLSFLIAGAITLATNITPLITWQVILIASVMSVGVGIIFGSFPALKAARKDPIAALRNE